MKKIIFAAAGVCLLGLASCNGGSPSANLKTDVDTVSYELGLANTNNISAYFEQMQIDSVYREDFLRGVIEGAQVGENKKKKAYLLGLQAGQQMGSQMVPYLENRLFAGDSTQHLSMKNLLAGFAAGIHNKTALEVDGKKVGPAEANEELNERMQAISSRYMEQRYGDKKKAALDYMKKVGKEEGVKPLTGGVFYKVLSEGTGEKPAANATVMVNYEGRLTDGRVFDSSIQRSPDKPVGMPVQGVIEGMRTALMAMPVGSEWEIYIPYDKAYGEMGQGEEIPPFSNLIFKVKLVEIKK